MTINAEASGRFKKACPEFLRRVRPVLSFAEGKAAASFARRASFHYVSRENWRERRWRLFSTAPYAL